MKIILIRNISGFMLTLCYDIDLIWNYMWGGAGWGSEYRNLSSFWTAKHLNLALWTPFLVSKTKKKRTLCQTGNPNTCQRPESEPSIVCLKTKWDIAKEVCVKYEFNLEQGEKK